MLTSCEGTHQFTARFWVLYGLTAHVNKCRSSACIQYTLLAGRVLVKELPCMQLLEWYTNHLHQVEEAIVAELNRKLFELLVDKQNTAWRMFFVVFTSCRCCLQEQKERIGVPSCLHCASLLVLGLIKVTHQDGLLMSRILSGTT